MRVYSDDFNLDAAVRVEDRTVVSQRILDDRIRGMRSPTDRGDWHVELVVESEPGELVGWTSLYPQGRDWKVLETSSWVAPLHRGRRYSETMRIGVLALAFDGIGAELAVSRAQPGNRSNAISIRLGYVPESPRRHSDGYLYRHLRKEQWEAIRPANIELDGYQAFRTWLAQSSDGPAASR